MKQAQNRSIVEVGKRVQVLTDHILAVGLGVKGRIIDTWKVFNGYLSQFLFFS